MDRSSASLELVGDAFGEVIDLLMGQALGGTLRTPRGRRTDRCFEFDFAVVTLAN